MYELINENIENIQQDEKEYDNILWIENSFNIFEVLEKLIGFFDSVELEYQIVVYENTLNRIDLFGNMSKPSNHIFIIWESICYWISFSFSISIYISQY